MPAAQGPNAQQNLPCLSSQGIPLIQKCQLTVLSGELVDGLHWHMEEFSQRVGSERQSEPGDTTWSQLKSPRGFTACSVHALTRARVTHAKGLAQYLENGRSGGEQDR